jgi:hypothetical protein
MWISHRWCVYCFSYAVIASVLLCSFIRSAPRAIDTECCAKLELHIRIDTIDRSVLPTVRKLRVGVVELQLDVARIYTRFECSDYDLPNPSFYKVIHEFDNVYLPVAAAGYAATIRRR